VGFVGYAASYMSVYFCLGKADGKLLGYLADFCPSMVKIPALLPCGWRKVLSSHGYL